MRETMFMPEKPVQIPDYPDLKRKGPVPAYLKYFWRDLVLLMVFLASMGICSCSIIRLGLFEALKFPLTARSPSGPGLR